MLSLTVVVKMLNFKKRGFIRAVNEFSPQEDPTEVVNFAKRGRVAGEVVFTLPGNGGISAITFREKERPATIAE
jgi:hypothetical protein